jgi:type II secretory pathway pseudopilin PulG
VRFYIGHELGHIKQGHLTGGLWRLPVLWLPLLGAAYARAQERTCDLHGRACSSSGVNAARALGALVVGGKRWATLNLDGLAEQLPATRGFWMSFHELIGAYPWLTKRIAKMEARAIPGRHPLAWLLALFTPYGGRAGGGAAGALVVVAVIGVLAAVAIPAYKDYTDKAKLAQALVQAQVVQTALAEHYLTQHQVPDSLDAVDQPTLLASGALLSLNPDNMVLTLEQGKLKLELVPSQDGKTIRWGCRAAEGTRPAALPASCR